jgi:hypothetical protein
VTDCLFVVVVVESYFFLYSEYFNSVGIELRV